VLIPPREHSIHRPGRTWLLVAAVVAVAGVGVLPFLPGCALLDSRCVPPATTCTPACQAPEACIHLDEGSCECREADCDELYGPGVCAVGKCPAFKECVSYDGYACLCASTCRAFQCGGACPPGQACVGDQNTCHCEPVGCGGAPPQCAGACSFGDTCQDVGGVCTCAAAPFCGQLAAPQCGAGLCQPGQTCVAIDDTCTCRIPCGSASADQCGLGFCDGGQSCVAAGGACGCQTVADTCATASPQECRNSACSGGAFCVRTGAGCGCGVQAEPALSGIGQGGVSGNAVVAPAAGLSNALVLFSTLPSGGLKFEQIWQDGTDGEVGLGSAIDADVLDVDPSNRRVAVAAPGDDAISLWKMGPTPEDFFLEYFSSLQKNPSDPDLDDFTRPISVEWSPDGKNLYVLTTPLSASAALWTLSHDAVAGTLAFAQKLTAGTDIPFFGFPSDVVVSPDGKNAYATGFSASTLTIFNRDTATGLLTVGPQLRDGVGGVDGLLNPAVVTVSPDGTEVYAGGTEGFVIFDRNPSDGTLAVHQIVVDDATTSLSGIEGIAVTADGSNLYVGSSFNGPALTRFVRGQDDLFAPVRSVQDAQIGAFGPITIRPDGTLVVFAFTAIGVFQANLDLIERENGQVLNPPAGAPSPMTIAPALAFATALGYRVPANVGFALASNVVGESPGQQATFDITLDLLETYAAELTYPSGFTFNGFTAIGPPGTTVATYAFDVERDGRPELVLSVRSIDADTAYVDLDFDRSPGVDEPTIKHTGQSTFRLVLPKGGDGRTDSIGARTDARRTVALAAGLLRNPATPGTYTLQGAFTSVDPDTGGPSDGQGESPLAFATDATSCPACVVTVGECITAATCDDGDPCTDAACTAGRCVHTRRAGATGNLCALRSPALCGTEAVPTKVRRAITRAADRAEALLRAAATTRARAADRKLRRKLAAAVKPALKQVKQARKTRKISRECADSISAMLTGLRSP
jgi:hypothetical protein